MWLYSKYEKHNIACGQNGNERSYWVDNHMVEVSDEDAYLLLDHVETESRLRGRIQQLVEVYRVATDAEINSFLANHPEQAQARAEKFQTEYDRKMAELDRQAQALEDQRKAMQAAMPSGIPPMTREPQDTNPQSPEFQAKQIVQKPVKQPRTKPEATPPQEPKVPLNPNAAASPADDTLTQEPSTDDDSTQEQETV